MHGDPWLWNSIPVMLVYLKEMGGFSNINNNKHAFSNDRILNHKKTSSRSEHIIISLTEWMNCLFFSGGGYSKKHIFFIKI